jgi:hypothetical protein
MPLAAPAKPARSVLDGGEHGATIAGTGTTEAAGLPPRKSCLINGRKSYGSAYAARLERARGIEPLYEAWEASVLPLNYARAVWRRSHNNRGRAEGEALGAAATIQDA